MSRMILTRGDLAHDGAHRFETGQARHRQIEQQDVGLEFERLGDGDVAVFGLADDLEAGLVQQHVLDAEADYGVIVGDDDADGWDAGCRFGGLL